MKNGAAINQIQSNSINQSNVFDCLMCLMDGLNCGAPSNFIENEIEFALGLAASHKNKSNQFHWLRRFSGPAINWSWIGFTYRADETAWGTARLLSSCRIDFIQINFIYFLSINLLSSSIFTSLPFLYLRCLFDWISCLSLLAFVFPLAEPMALQRP